MADNLLTKRTHGVRAYWDDYQSVKTEFMGRVVYPSKEEAYAAATAGARMLGAPGQARVIEEYDASYMIDSVVVQWITPVWSEQPPDIFIPDRRFEGGPIQPRIKITRRLGDIPR